VSAATGVVGKAKAIFVPPRDLPQYTYRVYDGKLWHCPEGAVDMGDQDRQCLVSDLGPPIWKVGGDGSWGWHCPNGTTPTDSSDWENKCVKGHSARQLVDGKWTCLDTETDTGKNWENSNWYDAHKQCYRNSTVFTTRMSVGGKWMCPPGTTDTGYSWNQGYEIGRRQCKYDP
jgi:hypothetical protein